MHSAIFLKIDNFLTMGENITTWIQSGQGFESGWMSVELLCYVKTIVFFINFATSFVGGVLL